jgi:protein TonB
VAIEQAPEPPPPTAQSEQVPPVAVGQTPEPPPPAIEAEQVPPPPVEQTFTPPPRPPQAKPPKQAAARAELAKPMTRQMLPATGISPVETAPPVSTPSTGPVLQATPEPPSANMGWDEILLSWLEAHKTYPEIACRRGQQGTVTLRFSVAADGNVLDVAVVTGSGSPLLDDAAQETLRGAKLPAPGTKLTRTVRLRYRFED